EAPTRPRGGGRHRHGDREVPAAIVFVATPGRTWHQLPPASLKGGHEQARLPPHSMVLDLGSYLEWDRAEVVENARASGCYDAVRRPLVISDPERPDVVHQLTAAGVTRIGLGCRVVAFDFSGHGESAGKPSQLGLLRRFEPGRRGDRRYVLP
ncbi:hypothetical protein ABT314_35435, partial [Streptomyces spiralis]